MNGSATATRRVRKLKSQYPRDSPDRHVEYILVASFDVDKGPTMEHQFPGAISGDENMLAELMLPDQAHVRSEDWTIFFLHKDTTEEDELKEERRLKRKQRKEDFQRAREAAAANGGDADLEAMAELEDSAEEDEDEGGEGPPLIYVLNLVNTKQDNSLKRCLDSKLALRTHADSILQRCRCQSHGHMHKTLVSPYL